MMRRMPERNKRVVASVLGGALKFDPLYTEPHDDKQVCWRVCRRCPVCPQLPVNLTEYFLFCAVPVQGPRPAWPTNAQIEYLKKLK
jgi:hypothetical protein